MINSRLFVSFFVAIICSASAITESTIAITIVNNTNHNFEISHVDIARGARVEMAGNTIAPHSTVVVLGTAVLPVDLKATIYFNKNTANLTIDVRRLKHFGQPLLAMHAEGVSSLIKRVLFNSDGGPNELSYVAATVEVEAKE